ncbi:MAG: PQQ-binding-like beta-propeller repeat protein [Haloferacaceae archaeon]
MTTRRRFLRTLGAGAALGATGTAGCLGYRPPGLEFDPLRDRGLDEHASAQFRGGLQNLGTVDAAVPDAVTVDWSLPVNRGSHTAAKSTPVATPDGDVVIAGDTGTVRRVAPDGRVRWEAAVDPVTRGVHGTPAVANETVYVGAYDGAMYAFDLATGERRWRTRLGDAIGSSPVYFRGVVYVAVEYGTPSGSVAAVHAGTGERLWLDRRPTDQPHSTVAIDREAGRLVVGANDGVCYGWSFPDLERAWAFETGGPIKGPVATAAGLAVFGSWDQRVYAVDLSDSTEVWSVETGQDVMSGPAVDDGVVYVGSHDGHLYALDLATGERRWRFPAGGWLIGSVTAAREHVLVGSYDDRLYAVRKADGTEAWHVAGRGHATSAALVTDDAVYYAERAPNPGDSDVPGRLYRLVPA